MNIRISILALIEIISALSIGLIMLSLTYTILKRLGQKYYDIQHGNLAFSIFIASILFSVGFMMSSVIQPILSSFRVLTATAPSEFLLILSFLGYGALYVGIAYTSTIIISILGIYIYRHLTPIDELDEIKNNNVGVAIVVSVIIIVLVMMSKSGITLFIESIIPYPEIPPS